MLAGAGVAVVFAIAAAAIVTVVRGHGGSGRVVMDPGPNPLTLVPTAGAPAPSAHSDAAALLVGRGWDALSATERTSVVDAVTRAWSDADVRMDVGTGFPIDIYRRGGHTAATVTYQAADLNFRQYLAITTAFFCPQADGQVAVHRWGVAADQVQYTTETLAADKRPWDYILRDARWETATDLGLRDIGGARARGIKTAYPDPNTGELVVEADHWLDVETGRLLEWDVRQGQASASYRFTWARLPRPAVPEGQDADSCVRDLERQLTAAAP
jgi:hypothetical protein